VNTFRGDHFRAWAGAGSGGRVRPLFENEGRDRVHRSPNLDAGLLVADQDPKLRSSSAPVRARRWSRVSPSPNSGCVADFLGGDRRRRLRTMACLMSVFSYRMCSSYSRARESRAIVE
jgi:hypothetical protein